MWLEWVNGREGSTVRKRALEEADLVVGEDDHHCVDGGEYHDPNREEKVGLNVYRKKS